MSLPIAILKSGRDIPVRAGHPWIFSGAIEREVQAERGSLVRVHDKNNDFIGIGSYHPVNSIRIRMITREEINKLDTEFFIKRFKMLEARKLIDISIGTEAFRLIQSDADYMPGLIIDNYNNNFVFQIHNSAFENSRPQMIDALKQVFHPKTISERSDIDARKQDGLDVLSPKVHYPLNYNSDSLSAEFRENGIKYEIDILKGQKTGWFLDQRKARAYLQESCKNYGVIDLFSYGAGFGVSGIKGGALFSLCVDSSGTALTQADRNFSLNNIPKESYKTLKSDVFNFLGSEEYQKYLKLWPAIVVCDPPAFAKSKDQLKNARKAYIRLNKLCMKPLKQNDVLISCSCSGGIKLDEFIDLLRVSAGECGREFNILKIINQAPDHTIKLSFPEAQYLKVIVLRAI